MTRETTRGGRGLMLAAALLAPACRRADADMGYVEHTPHEAYEAQLQQVGLDTTALGREWMEAARRSLTAPINVLVPHREARFLDPEGATALGYHLKLNRGQRLVASVDAPPSATGDLRVFLDLFLVDGTRPPRPVMSGEGGGRKLSYKVYRSGDYYLRVQPELLSGGPVTIDLAAEMGFPVAGRDAGAIKSEFGDPRDGGRREHEGVDIFAPIGTPVIATLPGRITRVGKDRLGGNVVWLRNDSTGHRIYYAHLLRWVVHEGDSVTPGDTLGFVGNTGNARHTLPHLHFAIYAPGVGPVDPISQLRDRIRDAPPLAGNAKLMGGWAQVTAQTPVLTRPDGSAPAITWLPRGAPVEVLAAMGRWYLARLPGVGGGYLAMREIRPLGVPQRRAVPAGAALLAAPTNDAQRLDSVAPGEEVAVLGPYRDQVLVQRAGGLTGWMARDRFDAPRVTQSRMAGKPAEQKPVAQARATQDSEMRVTSAAVTLRLPNADGLNSLAVPTPPALRNGAGAPNDLTAFAGQWTIQTLAPGSLAVLGSFRLSATPTPQGWSMLLPGRADPVPLHVVTRGDSVVLRGGPYASAFRTGVSVSTKIVTRLVNGALEGSQVVRYRGGDAGPDAVRTFLLRGTRAR